MRPQRNPNGLVTGPDAGQIRPADDGVDDGPLLECCACAAWMRAVSAALEACSESISSASARSEAESCERSVSFCCFVRRDLVARTEQLVRGRRVSAPCAR